MFSGIPSDRSERTGRRHPYGNDVMSNWSASYRGLAYRNDQPRQALDLAATGACRVGLAEGRRIAPKFADATSWAILWASRRRWHGIVCAAAGPGNSRVWRSRGRERRCQLR